MPRSSGKNKGVQINEDLNTFHRYSFASCFTSMSSDARQVENLFISYANNYKIFEQNKYATSSSAIDKRDTAMLNMMNDMSTAVRYILNDRSIIHASSQINRICSNFKRLCQTFDEIWQTVYSTVESQIRSNTIRMAQDKYLKLSFVLWQVQYFK